jgi:hypothetical protein
MNNLKGSLKICILFFISSCGATEKANDTFKRILNSPQSSSSQNLNFDGGFCFNSEKQYFLTNTMYFFKNGLIYNQEFSVRDSSIHEKWIRKYLSKEKTWGTYEIKKDTINASIYEAYYDYRAHYIQTCYQGIIKNKDTILQWHMVAPYPKLTKTKALSENYHIPNYGRYNLYFKQLAIKTFMDSISEKAWVNKYRDK